MFTMLKLDINLIEEKSQEQIAKDLNVSQWTISNILRKNNITIRSKTAKLALYRKKYFVDETVLDSLTPQVAWVIGWFLSDGYINKDNSFGINVSEKDIDIIKKLKDFFKYTGPILSNRIKLKKTGKTYNQKILKITSKKLKNNLELYGVVNNKSTKEKFPILILNSQNIDLYRNFIKGVFEGDGSIICSSQTVFQIVGTRELLSVIQNILISNLNVKKTKISINGKSKVNHYCLRYSGRKQCKRIFDWMYFNSTWHLDRKHNKYLEKICVE